VLFLFPIRQIWFADTFYMNLFRKQAKVLFCYFASSFVRIVLRLTVEMIDYVR